MIQQVVLDNESRQRIALALDQCASMRTVCALAPELVPESIAIACATVLAPGGVDCLLIRGLPLPPLADGLASRTEPALQALPLAFAALAGVPVGLAEECDGELIQDVRPSSCLQPGRSDTNAIGWHLDAEILRHGGEGLIPDGLLLNTLQNDAKGPTYLLHADDIIARLSRNVIDALQSHEFVITAPGPLKGVPYKLDAVPALEHHSDFGYRFNGTPPSLTGTTLIARNAVDALEHSLLSCGPIRVTLEAGDLLLWSQRRVLHARPSFVGRRWLQRVFVARRSGPLAIPGVTALVHSAAAILREGAPRRDARS